MTQSRENGGAAAIAPSSNVAGLFSRGDYRANPTMMRGGEKHSYFSEKPPQPRQNCIEQSYPTGFDIIKLEIAELDD